MRTKEVIRDSFKTLWAHKIFTLTTASIVAIISLLVLLTAGQGAALEQQVINQMNTAATKLISIADQGQPYGIDPAAVNQLQSIEQLDWVIGLGEASDYNNTVYQLQDTGVAGRIYYDDLPSKSTLLKGRLPDPGQALLTPGAAEKLGLEQGYGSIALNTLINQDILKPNDARIIAVVGIYQPPPGIKPLENTILIKGENPETDQLKYLYAMAKSTSDVKNLTGILKNSVQSSPTSQINVEPPSGMIDLTNVISGKIGQTGRQTMLLVLGVGIIIITVIQLTMTAAKRKDYGRRRALGASRTLIITQVITQTTITAIPAATIGTISGLLILQTNKNITPAVNFTISVWVLTILTTIIAAILPAIASALQDPAKILRVP